MKSSSFLCGVLLGAGAAIWASRRKAGTGLMSLMGGASTALKFAEQDKIDQSANHSSASYTHHQNSYKGPVTSAQEYPSSVSSAAANHSKEYNLKQITDFIKGNGDVRKEVEAILKETNTVIPGI
ncbi:hypothetical protein D3C74_170980 [compost metagenome]